MKQFKFFQKKCGIIFPPGITSEFAKSVFSKGWNAAEKGLPLRGCGYSHPHSKIWYLGYFSNSKHNERRESNII